MARLIRFFLVVFGIISSIKVTTTAGTCSEIPHKSKIDCGYHGIKKLSCLSKGCEWCPTTDIGVPWCVHQTNRTYNCSIYLDKSKIDCHIESNANRVKCEQRGCLWCESKTSGVPWCFHKNASRTNTSNQTNVAPTVLTTGEPSISKLNNCSIYRDENKMDCHSDSNANRVACELRGCIWCESNYIGIPWCFHANASRTSTPNSLSASSALRSTNARLTSNYTYNCSLYQDRDKIDCHSESNANQEKCELRGCLWCESGNPGIPWCFYKRAPRTRTSNHLAVSSTKWPTNSPPNVDSVSRHGMTGLDSATSRSSPLSKAGSVVLRTSTSPRNAGNVMPCPRLTAPKDGRVVPNTCTTRSSAPKTTCNVLCYTGFKAIGYSRVTCLPEGRWSQYLSNTCLDIDPPRIICPENFTITLRHNETTAILKWARPIAYDNSGVPPRITESLAVFSRRPEGNYTVWMTALDEVGLASHCSFVITVSRNRVLLDPAISSRAPVSSTTIVALSVALVISIMGFLSTLIFHVATRKSRSFSFRHVHTPENLRYENKAYDIVS